LLKVLFAAAAADSDCERERYSGSEDSEALWCAWPWELLRWL
jgi:hypothetical protein